jgi:hypothetical protein
MDLIADGAGLIPSDLDAERELVDCVIVDPRCDATLAVEPFFDPHCQRFYALSQASGQRGERPVSKAAWREGLSDGRSPRRRRLPRDPGGGPIRPAGQPGSNWTTSPVHTDRTDTPNPELVARPCRSKAALYRVIGRRGTASLCLEALSSPRKTCPCPQRSNRPHNINEKAICDRSQMAESGG